MRMQRFLLIPRIHRYLTDYKVSDSVASAANATRGANMAITATQTTVESAIEIVDLTQGRSRDADPAETEPTPGPDDGISKSVYLKLVSAGFSFFVAGVNDGSIGALIPYVIREYNVSTAIVSSV